MGSLIDELQHQEAAARAEVEELCTAPGLVEPLPTRPGSALQVATDALELQDAEQRVNRPGCEPGQAGDSEGEAERCVGGQDQRAGRVGDRKATAKVVLRGSRAPRAP